MSIQVDWHSHILPGIDDGSQSVEESLSLLEMEAAQGINRVIATPHFYAHHDRPERFLENRQEAADRLRRAMGNRVGLPDIRLGAEVYFFRGMSHADILPHLAIQGTRYILVEMPQPPWPEDLYRELEEIVAYHGLTPIIAHIDRYIEPFHTYGIPRHLEQLPVLVQANASFFLHSRTKGMALKMVQKGQIHLLGSDCHNLTTRPPRLGEAVGVIARKWGYRQAAKLLWDGSPEEG